VKLAANRSRFPLSSRFMTPELDGQFHPQEIRYKER
jgi:hypothetical protein